MLKATVLKTGLTLIKIPKEASNLTVVGFVASTGKITEQLNFSPGISQLVKRLFWCGTDKHPSTRHLNLILETIGGNFSSYIGQELTQLYLTVPNYQQFKAVSLMADLVQRSFFDNRDIEEQKRLLMEQTRLREMDPLEEISQIILNNLLQPNSLNYGAMDSVLSINKEQINEYLAGQYRPDTSFLVISGNFDDSAVTELMEQEWGYWNPKTIPFAEVGPIELETDEFPKIIYRPKVSNQTELVFSFVVDSNLLDFPVNSEEKTDFDTEKFLAGFAQLLVLNAILGQGLSSRLWTKGIEEEMLFNQIESQVVKHKMLRYLQITGFAENTQFSFGLESILSVLEGLKKTTVSINELSKAKEYLKGRFILEHEDLLTRTAWQIEQLLGTGLQFELKDLLDQIQKVQAPQLRALACDLFLPEKMFIAILGTAKETKLVDRLIRKYLG